MAGFAVSARRRNGAPTVIYGLLVVAVSAGSLVQHGRNPSRQAYPHDVPIAALLAYIAADIKHHLGVSGFATHAVVDQHSVVPVGDDVPPDIAAVLGCAVLTGGGAVINAGRPTPGQAVMVVGLGGVGMAALITALSLGEGEVIGVDSNPDKLTQSTKLGASATYTPQDVAELNIQAPIVIEAAGRPRAFETALAATAPGGTTVTVGLPAPDARSSISPLALVAGARTIIGSYLGSAVPARDIPVFAQLWRDGKLPVEKLISSRITLSDINSAMDQLADGNAIRQVIIFDEK